MDRDGAAEEPHSHDELFAYFGSILARSHDHAQVELLAHWADLDNALWRVAVLARSYLATEAEADRRALQMALAAAESAERVLARRMPDLVAASGEPARASI